MNGHNKKILRNSGNICNKCHLGRTNKYSKVARINITTAHITNHHVKVQRSTLGVKNPKGWGVLGVGEASQQNV